MDLIEAGTVEYSPYNGTVEDYLFKRIRDNAIISSTPEVRDALSPLVALSPDARTLIRNKLCEGAGKNRSAARRKSALAWVSSLLDVTKPIGWDAEPKELEADHWDDLRLGAQFFTVRDTAIDVLNAVEKQMAFLADRKLVVADVVKLASVQEKLRELHEAAQGFLNEKKAPTFGVATAFCAECIKSDPADVVRNLVERDGRVLRLVGNHVLPGAAFALAPQTETSDENGEGAGAKNEGRVPVPPNISGRIRNLYLLELDLQGRLDEFLNPSTSADAA
jgi:hypothetical protein